MKNKVDIVIIGAGVIGICSAYYLLKKGYKVCILEKGDICSGCSYGNAGLIVPSHCIPLAKPGVISQGLQWMLNPDNPFYIKIRMDRDLYSWLWKFRSYCNLDHVRRAIPILHDLSQKSLQLYKELAQQEGLDFNFEQRGLLYVFKKNQTLKTISEEALLMKEFNLEIDILNASQILEMEPTIRSDISGGVFYPQDAHIRPDLFVRSLSDFVSKQGVDILTSTEVIGMETFGNTITAVKTTRGDFSTKEIILAGGVWSPEIVKDLQLNLPIQPAKGYSITVKKSETHLTIPLMFAEAKVIVTPMGDLLRFGGTLELAGMDLSINQRRIEAIVKAVPEYLSDMDPNNFQLVEIWRGLRPCTPDGLPIIGRSSTYHNLIVATGHAMLGMSLGPVTGKIIAQLVYQEEPDINLAELSVERF